MKKIVLILASLCFAASTLSAQNTEDIPFNGLITTAEGKGIKARITLKSSGKFTIANSKGEFGLTNVDAADTLLIKYKSDNIEIPVAGRKSLKVIWVGSEPIYSEDQDLVDTGYGYIKRREYASASSGTSGEDMIRKGFTDLHSAILGLFAGVQYIGGEYVIRGVGSINSGIGALILLDGLEVRDISSINIYDVKSIEVQKGANMYGVRGANGVILIRTRTQ